MFKQFLESTRNSIEKIRISDELLFIGLSDHFSRRLISGGETGNNIKVFWLCASGEKRRKKDMP
jgi:hypothetical protein